MKTLTPAAPPIKPQPAAVASAPPDALTFGVWQIDGKNVEPTPPAPERPKSDPLIFGVWQIDGKNVY